MTTLENEQLFVTFLDAAESLIGTGQDVPCGMRCAPFFFFFSMEGEGNLILQKLEKFV